eukprot:gnl/TRDRNA2_/TRDRNA2_38576_c0_seq1.p1 gnl/TRDRNA2_/TRDRNA2_38576_c0~~gnl/TRDRNA2_/TRDRNA2_38576_c0_seq1.p1  ORF type:complete len:648 (+),score=131.68 gnl/TRDRNA2_/TRDRNA2_38576_c0_seq1:135-2078(+)
MVSQALWGIFALLTLTTPTSAGFVQMIQPSVGSVCGGSRISIIGSGFSPKPEDNRVVLGDTDCDVLVSTASQIVCDIPYRALQIIAPEGSVSVPVGVKVRGSPLLVPQNIQFTWDTKVTPLVDTFGPTAGQGGEIIAFEGKGLGASTTVSMNDHKCEVRSSSDMFLQCITTGGAAGITDVKVHTSMGYACQGPKAPPLRYVYLLVVQSVHSADWGCESGCDAAGPMTGGGAGMTVVGQGFDETTVLKLCDGAAMCHPTSPPKKDSTQFHEGDDSFMTLTCVPDGLQPNPAVQVGWMKNEHHPCIQELDGAKTAGGVPAVQFGVPWPSPYNRTCELTAEAAGGLLQSTLNDAWTFMWIPPNWVSPEKLASGLGPGPGPSAAPSPGPFPAPSPGPAFTGAALPAPSPGPVVAAKQVYPQEAAAAPAQGAAGASASVPGNAPAPAAVVAPAPAAPAVNTEGMPHVDEASPALKAAVPHVIEREKLSAAAPAAGPVPSPGPAAVTGVAAPVTALPPKAVEAPVTALPPKAVEAPVTALPPKAVAAPAATEAPAPAAAADATDQLPPSAAAAAADAAARAHAHAKAAGAAAKAAEAHVAAAAAAAAAPPVALRASSKARQEELRLRVQAESKDSRKILPLDVASQPRRHHRR